MAEHHELIRNDSVDFIQPDAPRVGGITPFLKICALADHKNLQLAPHYCMEILGDTQAALSVNNEVLVPKWALSAAEGL